MMFFDFSWKSKNRVTPYQMLATRHEEKLQELCEIRKILEPFDGLKQNETAVEQAQTVRDILLTDRVIIQQQSRDIESLQEQLQEVTANRQEMYAAAVEEIGKLKKEILGLQEQQVMLTTTTPTKKPVTRSRSRSKA